MIVVTQAFRMQIEVLTSGVSDNFFYLVHESGDAVLVDPVDATVAVEAVRRAGIRSVRVLITHGHPDHVAGNDAVVAALGCPVIAPAVARSWPVRHDVGVGEGDVVAVGGETLCVMAAPGHTDDHLVYVGPDFVLSGDVFFVGGCGHTRLGGDGPTLARTFARLRHLPGTMRFFPGHDYARQNLPFVLDLLGPGTVAGAAARGVWQRAASWSREQGPLLHPLGVERSFNPFHRVEDPEVRAAVMARYPELVDLSLPDDGTAIFVALRRARDAFKA